MKRLYLVRHAKSSWNDSRLSDFERPLNERGERDAPVMGKRLAAGKIKPDVLITSAAKRAQTTARTIAGEIGYPLDRIIVEKELYLADVKYLFKFIRHLDDELDEVMLFGHNPGFTEVANYLTREKIENMPTCSIFCIDFDVDSWRDISGHSGICRFFDYPKKSAE